MRAVLYTNNLRDGLTQLASERWQRQLWLAAEGPYVGSFEEAVCQTYDDTGLTDLIDRPGAEPLLGKSLLRALRDLSVALDQVDATEGPERIIDSPQMTRVRVAAARALRSLDDSGLPQILTVGLGEAPRAHGPQ